MKKPLFIALSLLFVSGCSKNPQRQASKYVDIVFDGKPEVVVAAKSVTADRHCLLHGDAFFYRLIHRRMGLVDAVVDFERMRREKIFFETLPIAPNAIPFPPDWIFSQSEYQGGRIIPLEGTSDLIYEYCPTCEGLMQNALKSEPNKALQTMTMTVPVIVMSDF